MKKRYIASAVGASVAAGYLMKSQENRDKIKRKFSSLTKKNNTSDNSDSTLENAGIPDETKNIDLAQLENSKMVSEGSLYGVSYYNEAKEEEINRERHS